MKKIDIDFSQTGGFPFDADILADMQSTYSIYNSLAEVFGDKAIIKGCKETGNYVSDGVVYLNGEILPFKGGLHSSTVVVVEENQTLKFEDGADKNIITKKYVKFGNGIKSYKWSSFVLFGELGITIANMYNNANLIMRLREDVDILQRALPIGLVAIWDKPAEHIPFGWVEHTDMSGYTPVGHKKGDREFGKLGGTVGEKYHKLTIEEMPSHSHDYTDVYFSENNGRDEGQIGSKNSDWDNSDLTKKRTTSSTGGGIAHNNIQPSRIVKFIRFVGFDNA